MADETRDQTTHDAADTLSRRDFVTLGVAAGIAAATASGAAAGHEVIETEVTIKTPDGSCEAAFSYPTGGGAHPAVIIWTDAFGLRPSMRDMARRVASEGYAVLVPNPFYRVAKAPVIADLTVFSFSNTTDRAKLTQLMGSIGAEGAAERDAVAFVNWLDAQKQVDKTKKIGTQGYCMGGPLVMRTAAALPNRVGAVGSFHGGGLVTATPTSPHLLIPKMRARFYVGIASNDDSRQPEAKDVLKAAFAAAKRPAEIEVYKSLHGWCVPDMPADANGPIYNKPEAEKAWAKLMALYKTALA
ncbi:MAG: dienelactone hydrolase family protein [Vicinamibacterales bacterium]